MTRPSLRVGGIDYLNALPLTRYLSQDGDPPLELSSHSPSVLASSLRSGALDVALAPVVEFLSREDYEAVPGICISSYGAVESIRLFHRRPLAESRCVVLDASSRSSALLARLLFRELWKGRPRFVSMGPSAAREFLSTGEPKPPADAGLDPDAVLLIGDSALELREVPGWSVLDLGTEWTRWTGLPFVYAFWMCRRGVRSGVLEGRLREARDEGLSRLDDIVRDFGEAIEGFDAAARRLYLRQTIQYDFGELQQRGLQEFFSLLEKNGLTGSPPRLVTSEASGCP